jgi:DNA-binding PadR family transcriptional regulator
VLELLAEGPRHGYDIIKGIEERRGVRPSAGSVYPTLQLLEDGGFVTSEQIDGKRVYTITDSGRELLANRAADPDDDGEDEAPGVRHKLRDSVMKFVAAVWNARHTDDATLEKVREIVDKARKDVYTILASDDT